jgi:hypothetical protein
MATPKKILLFTNSEFGQANIILALSLELAIQGFEVHVASFAPLKLRITQLQDYLCTSQSDRKTGTIIFHLINGQTMQGKWQERNLELSHPPGVWGTIQGYRKLADCMVAWDGTEYIRSIQICRDLIREIHPAIVLVDTLFSQGVDACTSVSQKYVIVNPISPALIVGLQQPVAEFLFNMTP